MDQLISDTKQHMQKVLDIIHTDLSTIRAGKATPSLVDQVMINAYGGAARMKVLELATVTTQDSQTLLISPFDKSTLQEISKGILEANIGFTPSNDGINIRISIPPLSQERREQLIHLMKQKLENGKILIRQSRQEAMQELKKADLPEDENGRLEKEVQKVTDGVIEQVEAMGKQKEAELLQL